MLPLRLRCRLLLNGPPSQKSHAPRETGARLFLECGGSTPLFNAPHCSITALQASNRRTVTLPPEIREALDLNVTEVAPVPSGDESLSAISSLLFSLFPTQ